MLRKRWNMGVRGVRDNIATEQHLQGTESEHNHQTDLLSLWELQCS